MSQNPVPFALQWQTQSFSPPSVNPTPAADVTGRPYRSRKDRPCDACRTRKVHCDMPNGAPCNRCRRTTQECTFLQRPKRRQRPNEKSPSLGRDQPLVHGVHAVLNWNQAPDHPTCPAFETDTAVEPNLVQTPLSPDFEVANHQEWFDEGALSSLGTPQRLNESFDDTENSVTNRTNAPCSEAFGSQHMQSLEHVPGAFTFYIGPTGASDLYLLQRQEFAQNSCTSNVATGLKFRLAEKLSRDPRGPDHPEDGNRLPPTIFGITDYSIIDNAEPRLRDDQLKGLWSELWEIVDQHAAWRLVQLYVRFVEPCFPLLASHQAVRVPDHVTSLSLALLAGMCATAVPFTMYDEALYTLLPRPPTAQQLYRICWLALWQELHAPTLQTLQACLIFQHRPPCNAVLSDTAFQWSLMSTAVSIAQTIGLHREPASWHLVPIAERKLRRRLWWALYTLEKWSALARGMPSHITEEDYDVETLDTQDLEGSFCITSVSRAHFESLVALTRILMEVQHAFYTVRATKKMSNNLHTSLEAARSLRQKLCEWNEKLPIELKSRRMGERSVGELTPQVLDSNASLFLSYIATHMTLLRALLRPLDRWTVIVKHSLQEAKTLYDASLAVVKGAIICVKELVEFVEGLRDAQWNAFWHSWSRPNFAVAGSFMIHLLHIITPPRDLSIDQDLINTLYFQPQLEELHGLIKRWRWANRVSSNSAAGAKGLTNLGLFKVETMLASLRSDALPVESS